MSADTRAEKKAEKSAMKAQKKAKRYGEAINDAYDESERTISIEDAHRDVVYELPSTAKQIAQCFRIQMKRFTKQKAIYFLLVLLALMPVIFFLIKSLVEPDPMEGAHNINEYIATFLVFMPIMSTLICSILCGSMLPQEFNERTVYLSLPLPMSRKAFYYGKFLSGFVLAAGVISAAYGIAILVSMLYTTNGYTSEIFKSLWMCLCGAFFMCAFAYMLSARSKRGSSMKPFLILFIGIPALALGLKYLSKKISVEIFGSIASYFPTFSVDLGLAHLGTPVGGIPYIGFWGLLKSFGLGNLIDMSFGTDLIIMSVVTIILGILCLICGMRRISRRNM